MRTANPTLNEERFLSYARAEHAGASMTVGGTIQKSALLIGITVAAAIACYSHVMNAKSFGDIGPWLHPSWIVGFILCIVICFNPRLAPFLSVPYALCEGVLLGSISAAVNLIPKYHGIAFQAVALTTGIFVAMLMLYTSRTIRATPALTRAVVICTVGVFVVYMINFVANMFGAQIPFLHQTIFSAGAIGIGFSLFVVGLAAFNLILDFDLIERGAQERAPKYMEWYGSFGLLVTLVWLYFEVLWLLMKLRGRD
jgi:uncharacterized YccA/Bax inhibitor family protein